MVLLGTVIMPHGAMPFDGDPLSESPACRKRYENLDATMKDNLTALYQGMCAAGKMVADMKPDLVVLNSPHGVSLSDNLGIYISDTANGNALWNGEWSEFTVSARLDSSKSQELKTFFESSGIPVQGIRSFSGLECKLRWGEVIPMWYLQKYMNTDVKYIITTNDFKPKPSTVEDWRLDAGKKLAEFIEKLTEKVVVVISGDLAHYHPTICKNQLYLPDPSYRMQVNKEGSEALETAITAWVQDTLNLTDSKTKFWDPKASFVYLTEAVKQDPNAMACGAKGFVLLHGLMAHEVANDAKFTSKIVVHRVPTYYGMMVATFLKL